MSAVETPEDRERAFLGGAGITLRHSGGVDLVNPPTFRPIVGTQMVAVKLMLPEGFVHPRHNHPEHESIGTVVRGRLQMVIGEETVVLGPGDTWHHPIGVYHSVLALEATEAVETHSPLRHDLIELAAAADAERTTPEEN